jgi:hypothetical protein
VAGVVWIPWYATGFRKDAFAEAVSEIAPLALRYGATQYSVHRSRDDRYKITQMAWFESADDWYRYWNGPEMINFRRNHMSWYQNPITYVWHDELVAGAVGPEVPLPEREPEPQPAPSAMA